MIVSEYIKGDDISLAGCQSKVYRRSLRLILDSIEENLNRSAVVLGLSPPKNPEFDSFDHRLLQLHHDILAAAWRYREITRQGRITFHKHQRYIYFEFEWMDAWMHWIREEVGTWDRQPELIHCIRTVLWQKHSNVGRLCSARLTFLLISKFSDVAWNDAMINKKNDMYILTRKYPEIYDWPGYINVDYNRINNLNSINIFDSNDKKYDPPIVGYRCNCVRVGKVSCGRMPCQTDCEEAERAGIPLLY